MTEAKTATKKPERPQPVSLTVSTVNPGDKVVGFRWRVRKGREDVDSGMVAKGTTEENLSYALQASYDAACKALGLDGKAEGGAKTPTA